MRVETLPLSEHAVLTAYLHSDSPDLRALELCPVRQLSSAPAGAMHSVQMLSVTCRQFPF